MGYGGAFDPDYELTSSGALFATTYTGMRVMRDGCTFTTPLGTAHVSQIAQGADGKLYYAATDTPSIMSPGDSSLYRSDDDGASWPIVATPGQLNDWWQSLEVAPSSPARLYLSGLRLMPRPGGGTTKVFLLFRSDDAGQSWQALPTTQLPAMSNSLLEIAGISHTDPDLVFARIKLEDNMTSDAIYRSSDGGMTWTRILGRSAAIAFVVRRSGELLAATQAGGAVRSTDTGATWSDLSSAPHMSCLAENSAGEVWACTQNYGAVGIPSDGNGVMKSTDLTTWTGVLKYQDIKHRSRAPTVRSSVIDAISSSGAVCAASSAVHRTPLTATGPPTRRRGRGRGRAPVAVKAAAAVAKAVRRPRQARCCSPSPPGVYCAGGDGLVTSRTGYVSWPTCFAQ